MNAGSRSPSDWYQPVAARENLRTKTSTTADFERFTSDDVRALLHAMEIYKAELDVRNTQLHEARRAAEEATKRFRRLYDSAPTGFVALDAADTILDANRPLCALLKTPRAKLIGRKLSAFVATHCRAGWESTRRALFANRAGSDLALELAIAGGDFVHARIVAMQIAAPAAETAEIHLALVDVTGLRETERALRATVAAAALAEERERRRLAADLHDDAGQLVSLASIKVQALSRRGGADREREIRELDGILSAIRSRITSLSFQLSPPRLDDEGLTTAIRSLAEDLEKSHGLVTRITEEHELDLDASGRVTFYRAVRELLINVVRHSGVNAAHLRISRIGEMERIVIEDAGVGMSPRRERRGFGLLALRERLELMGGSLETRETPGGGTTVEVQLPRLNRVEAQGEDQNPTRG